MDLNGSIGNDYTEERTISKELTIFGLGVTGFLIVVIIEEHVADCLEIGSHKTR